MTFEISPKICNFNVYKMYFRIDAVALVDNRHSDVDQACTAF